jgi:hypothetical protein
MKIMHLVIMAGTIAFAGLCGFKSINVHNKHLSVNKAEKINKEEFSKVLIGNNREGIMSSIKYSAATVNTAPSFAPVTNTSCFASIPREPVDSKHFISAKKEVSRRMKGLDSK